MDQNNQPAQDSLQVPSNNFSTEEPKKHLFNKSLVMYIVLGLVGLLLAGLAAYQTITNMSLKKEMEELAMAHNELVETNKTLVEQHTQVSNELHLLKNPVVKTTDFAVQYNNENYQKLGQVFTVSENTEVTGVELPVKLGAGNTAYFYITELESLLEVDSETALVEATFDPKKVSEEGKAEVTFEEPVALVANTEYFLWVETQEETTSATLTYKELEGASSLYKYERNEADEEAGWMQLPNSELEVNWVVSAF